MRKQPYYAKNVHVTEHTSSDGYVKYNETAVAMVDFVGRLDCERRVVA